MSLLDVLFGAGSRSLVRDAGRAYEGSHVGKTRGDQLVYEESERKRKLAAEEAALARQAALDALSRRNIESQIAERERPALTKGDQFTYMGKTFGTPEEVAAAKAVIEPERPAAGPSLSDTISSLNYQRGVERDRREAAQRRLETMVAGGAPAHEIAKALNADPETAGVFTAQDVVSGWMGNRNKQTAAGSSRPPTEGERLASALLPEASQAKAVLEKLRAPGMLEKLASERGKFGNYFNTPTGRQFKQAATQFISAVQVAKSGKGVTEKEAERFYDQYIDMPNDDPATLEQKARARELGYQAIRIAAGSAADRVPAELLTEPASQPVRPGQPRPRNNQPRLARAAAAVFGGNAPAQAKGADSVEKMRRDMKAKGIPEAQVDAYLRQKGLIP